MAHEKSVPFGFAEIPAEEKADRVKGVFDTVASKYDVMNDAMSLGIHRIWKHDTMVKLDPRPGEMHLDVAGGTGELARAFLRRADKVGARTGHTKPAKSIVTDINAAMLEEGAALTASRSLEDRLDWVQANGEALPFASKSFDALTISFGIRNFTYRDRGLKEFYRVLKRGGRLAILEFSQLTVPALQSAYDAYSFNILPKLGQILAGDSEPYRYLAESIRTFPRPEAFAKEIATAGFRNIRHTSFTGGIAVLHYGWKI